MKQDLIDNRNEIDMNRLRTTYFLLGALFFGMSSTLFAQGSGIDEITTEIISSGGEIQQGEFGEVFSTFGQPLAADSTALDSDGGEASWTGFWHIVPTDSLSGVREEWTAFGVGASMITSAAPNPFSEEITLYVRLDKPGIVKLSVYSILGDEVIRLIDGVREAGTSRLHWSPEDLPGGIYMVRLEIEGTLYPATRITYAP